MAEKDLIPLKIKIDYEMIEIPLLNFDEFILKERIEIFAKRYYEKRGYIVFIINVKSKDLKLVRQDLNAYFPEVKIDFKMNGIPDLFIIKINHENNIFTKRYCFVEIKSKNDNLRLDQLLWFYKHKDVNKKVVYFVEQDVDKLPTKEKLKIYNEFIEEFKKQ